jgi:hypothetical protein
MTHFFLGYETENLTFGNGFDIIQLAFFYNDFVLGCFGTSIPGLAFF